MADPIVDPVSDNQALNQMVAELEDLNANLSQEYDRVYGDGGWQTVSFTSPIIRGAKADAVHTRVTNLGPNQLIVKENGVIVGVVAVATSCDLPLKGQGALNFSVASSGQTASIAVATYLND